MSEHYSGIYTVWGPPGTGKTTFLQRQTETIVKRSSMEMGIGSRTPVLICSLTRTAAAEIAGRKLPIPRQQISTLHAHCYRALGCPAMTEGQEGEWNKVCATAGRPGYMLEAKGGTVADLEDPDYDRTACGDGTGDALRAEYSLYRERQIDPRVWRRDVADWGRAWEQWKADAGLCDFQDLIEMARTEGTTPPGNPEVLIADEAQDLSKLEYATLKYWAAKCDACILAGDPWQALYTWRGANPAIFQDPDVPQEHRRVLSQSYRVSRAVHAVAMKTARHLSDYQNIEYRPTDEPGFVSRDTFTLDKPDLLVAAAERYLEAGLSVMVQVSAGYMLEALVKKLRDVGIPFANPWRRRRGDWNPLVVGNGVSMATRLLTFLRPDEHLYGPDDGRGWGARPWTLKELAVWASVLKADGVFNAGGKRLLEDAAERDPEAITGLEMLGRYFQPEAVQSLDNLFAFGLAGTANPDRGPIAAEWYKDRVLASKQGGLGFPMKVIARSGAAALRQPPRLYVGTIHSFKGAEADVVFVLPDLSWRGKRQWDNGGPEGRDSILRMYYVAFTRAKLGVVIGRPHRYYADFPPLT